MGVSYKEEEGKRQCVLALLGPARSKRFPMSGARSLAFLSLSLHSMTWGFDITHWNGARVGLQ
jgi:hypothetical protein